MAAKTAKGTQRCGERAKRESTEFQFLASLELLESPNFSNPSNPSIPSNFSNQILSAQAWCTSLVNSGIYSSCMSYFHRSTVSSIDSVSQLRSTIRHHQHHPAPPTFTSPAHPPSPPNMRSQSICPSPPFPFFYSRYLTLLMQLQDLLDATMGADNCTMFDTILATSTTRGVNLPSPLASSL